MFAGAVPSSLHQGVARLLTDDPWIAFELILRGIFGIDLPELSSAQALPDALDRFAPCFGDTHELRPDGVLVGETADLRDQIGLVIEVQKQPDILKRFRLWVYWALVAERLQANTHVLLIALTDAVSRWAARMAEAPQPAGALLLLDRQNMPVVTDFNVGRRHPAWITLSALIHGAHGNYAPLGAALPIVMALPDERRWRYPSYMLSAVPEDDRTIIKGALKMERYELSDIERKSIAYHDGLRDGRDEGRDEGRHEGRLEGRHEGRQQTLVEMILALLEVRAIPLDAGLRSRIAAASLEQLERWRELARHVARAEALFES